MVHDPRVSSCLARLGGVYHDPVRVDRDAATLLKSPVGGNLMPIVAELYESRSRTSTSSGGRGTATHVLVLQGTIAMHFKGQTYQILMDIYLPPGYPNRPPIPFVRLAPDMYLKENHRHVGSDGKVYMPYLHGWRASSHDLIELVVAMSSLFSAEPPVFTRRPGTTGPATSNVNRENTAFATATTSLNPIVDPAAAAAGGMLSDEEAIAAVQAQEARERAAAEERLQAEERRRQEEERLRLEEERQNKRALEAQEQWELQRTEQARVQVTAKLRQHLQEQARQTHVKITDELERELAKLKVAKKQKIEAPIEALAKQKAFLEQQLAVAEESKLNVESWIDEVTASKKLEDSTNNVMSIDDKVYAESPLHAQMMGLSAENAALSDALYFLDCAMQKGNLPCEVHLKQVRELAKRQFLVRAHLIKISQTVTLSSASVAY
ncbi:hypothetical protein ACA910_001091 [Epithemia clementina (nom. ined.)]